MFGAILWDAGPTDLEKELLCSVGEEVAGYSGICTRDDLRLPNLGREDGFFKIERTPWAEDVLGDAWAVELVCSLLLMSVDVVDCLQKASCKSLAILCGKML